MKFNVKGGVTMETCLQCGGHTFVILVADRPRDIGTYGLDNISVCATCGKTNILHSAPSLYHPLDPRGEEDATDSEDDPWVDEFASILEDHKYKPPSVEHYTVASDRVKLDPIKGTGTIEYGDLKKSPRPPEMSTKDVGCDTHRENLCESIAPASRVPCNGNRGHKGDHHHFGIIWSDDPQDRKDEQPYNPRAHPIFLDSVPDPDKIREQILHAKEEYSRIMGRIATVIHMSTRTYTTMAELNLVTQLYIDQRYIENLKVHIDLGMIDGMIVSEEK